MEMEHNDATFSISILGYYNVKNSYYEYLNLMKLIQLL